MSSKYVVTRYGVLLAHSLRCGFMIQRPKSQRFYTFILCYEKKLHIIFLCKTVVKIGIWSCWRQVAVSLCLFWSINIKTSEADWRSALYCKTELPPDWLSLSRGGGACWIVMNFCQWIDTFSHLTWFSCSEMQHCMKSLHTATKQTLTNAVRQETRVWVS